MNKKQLEKLKEKFILPVKKKDIIERVQKCLDNGVKIIKSEYNKDPIKVYFEKSFSKKKREHWEEYALSTYKLLDSPKP